MGGLRRAAELPSRGVEKTRRGYALAMHVLVSQHRAWGQKDSALEVGGVVAVLTWCVGSIEEAYISPGTDLLY